MNLKAISLVVIQFLAFSQLLCVDAMAAKAIGATARFVKGQAFYVTDSGKSPKRPIKLGTPFAEGDRIYTGPNGRVEVGFDTGGLILIDSKSEFAFGPKKVEDSGTFSAMISLVVGRIKSSVSKRTAGDKFEYHTKSAIIGIAGTPEHIISITKTADGQYLATVMLGPGDTGALTVTGLDAVGTTITLPPGMATTILQGLAPLPYFTLTPEMAQQFFQLAFQSLASSPAPPSSSGTFTQGNITGTAMDPAGNTLADQTVEVFNAKGELVMTTKSGANGVFSMDTLPAGDYIMKIDNISAPFSVSPPGVLPAGAPTAFNVLVSGSGGAVGVGAAAGVGVTTAQWMVLGGSVFLGSVTVNNIINNNNPS